MSGESTPFRTKKLMSESESGGSLPIGSVIYWAGIGQENNGVISYDIPDNWRVANGSALNKLEYNNLFEKIGHRFDNDSIIETNLKEWLADLFDCSSIADFEMNVLDDDLKLLVDGNGSGTSPISLTSIISQLKGIDVDDNESILNGKQAMDNLSKYFSIDNDNANLSYYSRVNSLLSSVTDSTGAKTALSNFIDNLYKVKYRYNNADKTIVSESSINTSSLSTFQNIVSSIVSSNSLISLRLAYYFTAYRKAQYDNYQYTVNNFNSIRTTFNEQTSFTSGNLTYLAGKGNSSYSGIETIRKNFETAVKNSNNKPLRKLYAIIVGTTLLLEEGLKGNLIDSDTDYSKLGDENYFSLPNLIDYYVKGGSNVGEVASARGVLGCVPNIKATFGCIDIYGNGTDNMNLANAWATNQNNKTDEAITVSNMGTIGASSGWAANKYKAVIDGSKISQIYSNKPLQTIEPSHVELIPIICVK